MAKESITSIRPDNRDVRSVTVALPKIAVPMLKQKFQEWIAEVLEVEQQLAKNEEVYQVNLQLFPFTKQTGGTKK